MIAAGNLVAVASVLKTHGIHGELNCELDINFYEFSQLACVFVELDGLYVPFFTSSLRQRGQFGILVSFCDLTDSAKAAALVGKELMAKKEDLPEYDDEDEEADGFYLADLVGYSISADGTGIGVLEGIDDSTANLLMLVRTPAGDILHIPAADEFFTDVDSKIQTIELSLPQGLLDINQ